MRQAVFEQENPTDVNGGAAHVKQHARAAGGCDDAAPVGIGTVDRGLDERGVGVVTEVETSVGVRGEEPDGRDAAGDAVGVGFFVGGERGASAGVGDDGGQALLAVFDDGEVFDEAGLFL